MRSRGAWFYEISADLPGGLWVPFFTQPNARIETVTFWGGSVDVLDAGQGLVHPRRCCQDDLMGLRTIHDGAAEGFWVVDVEIFCRSPMVGTEVGAVGERLSGVRRVLHVEKRDGGDVDGLHEVPHTTLDVTSGSIEVMDLLLNDEMHVSVGLVMRA